MGGGGGEGGEREGGGQGGGAGKEWYFSARSLWSYFMGISDLVCLKLNLVSITNLRFPTSSSPVNGVPNLITRLQSV